MSLAIILAYLALLLFLGVFTGRLLRMTGSDYFLASRGIGPFMLLMSVFGTTMTAFALVGSTGRTFEKGIGVYGLMASWSGIIHSAVFFLIGARVWALGKRHGYVTQLSFFRDRYRSDALVLLMFPLVVGFVMIYILMGVIGAGRFLQVVGGLPYWAGMGLICLVVLFYVFLGGMRATAWANTMQTLVFMVMGLVAFVVITSSLGGPVAATQAVLDHPEGATRAARTGLLVKSQFLTYCFIPLSVGMFPHLFQHWLTAKRASNFKLTVVAHPVCIMITWLPCVLLGMWAAGVLPLETTRENAVLAMMVRRYSTDVLAGLIGAGVLAAIMSSMDSQFLCIGSLFTNDIVAHHIRHDRLSERQRVLFGRGFVVGVVAVSFLIGLFNPQSVFVLGVWCFSGFASLFPLVFAALYWKRSNKYGAMASVLTVGVLWLWFLPRVLTEGEFLLFEMMPVTFMFAASLVVMVVVTLLTPAPERALVEKFFPAPRSAPAPAPAQEPVAP